MNMRTMIILVILGAIAVIGSAYYLGNQETPAPETPAATESSAPETSTPSENTQNNTPTTDTQDAEPTINGSGQQN